MAPKVGQGVHSLWKSNRDSFLVNRGRCANVASLTRAGASAQRLFRNFNYNVEN